MRKLVFDAIVARYNRKHNRLDEVSFNSNTDQGLVDMLRRREDLRARAITIEEYLTPLTDSQLLDVFDTQCCQDYR